MASLPSARLLSSAKPKKESQKGAAAPASSAENGGEAGKTSLGLEYFCNEGDATWLTPDADLIDLAARELAAIGLIPDAAGVVDGCVFRVPNAYPIYDEDYAEALQVLRGYLDGFDNLRTIGANGVHRYNNQDHPMVARRMAARQLRLGEAGDLCSINTEDSNGETESDTT